jgi:hypothetical protein
MFRHFTVEGGLVAAERAVQLCQLGNCDKGTGCNFKGFNLRSNIWRLYESLENDDFQIAIQIKRPTME